MPQQTTYRPSPAMVFKPFKPPSIRKPTQPQSQPPKPHTELPEIDDGPAQKRPRLSTENTNGAGNTRRRPLLQVSNVSASEASKPKPGSGSGSGAGAGDGVGDGVGGSSGEKYFNVLWYGISIYLFRGTNHILELSG